MRFLLISYFMVMMLYSVIAGAQDFYYVTVIRGIVRREDRSALKIGDKLLSGDKLIFADKNCRILLLHPQKGRFVVESEKKTSESTGEFLLFLKKNLHLQVQTMKLSSRGDVRIDDFFSGNHSCNSSLLFIGDTKIDLRHSGYLQADTLNNFFFLQYSTMDGKVYNHKLSILRDSLIIGKSSFVFNGARPTDSREVKIGYIKHYDQNKAVKQIAAFKPIFISVEDCKKVLLTIKQVMGGSKEKIIEEAYTQFCSLYGKPYIETLSSVFDQL